MTDVLTVMWKEYREFLRQRGNIRLTALTVILPMIILGFYFPYQMGALWVKTPVTLMMLVWIQLFLVNAIIADSFAGERERHTLETLLAGRLSDTAILMGKLCTAVSYAMAVATAVVLLGLITVNLSERGAGLIMFAPTHFIAGTLLCLITAVFIATAGIIISLRADSVRQAQQTLGLAIIVVGFLPGIVVNILPEPWKDMLGRIAAMLDPGYVLVAVLIAGMIVDITLFLVVRKRFTRSRMMLH